MDGKTPCLHKGMQRNLLVDTSSWVSRTSHRFLQWIYRTTQNKQGAWLQDYRETRWGQITSSFCWLGSRDISHKGNKNISLTSAGLTGCISLSRFLSVFFSTVISCGNNITPDINLKLSPIDESALHFHGCYSCQYRKIESLNSISLCFMHWPCT